MATLQIIRISEKVWKHVPSDLPNDFYLSKFYFSVNGIEFQIVEEGQSKRNKYFLSNITVFASDGGSPETFGTMDDLLLRLENLKYPAFYRDGDVSDYVLTVGEEGEAPITNVTFIEFSDSTTVENLGGGKVKVTPSGGGGEQTPQSVLTLTATLTNLGVASFDLVTSSEVDTYIATLDTPIGLNTLVKVKVKANTPDARAMFFDLQNYRANTNLVVSGDFKSSGDEGFGGVPSLQDVMEEGRSYSQTIGNYTYIFTFEEPIWGVSVINNVTSEQSQMILDIVNGSSIEQLISGFTNKMLFGGNFIQLATTGTSGLSNLIFQIPVNPVNGTLLFDLPNDIPNGSYLLSTRPLLKTTSFTAYNEGIFHTNGTITVTDPTPLANKGYIVYVIAGTTTINSVAYTAGNLIYRFYNGTAWVSQLINSDGASWGEITGTLSAQTDLQTALNAKQATLNETNFGTFANSLTAKTTLIDADSANLVDSADSNKAKKVTWLNVWNYIKSKADAIYQASLGFTPEDVANKKTDLTSTDPKDYPNVNAVRAEFNKAKFTVELMDVVSENFYAPQAMRINTVDVLIGMPTFSLFVDDMAYTLTDLITAGQKITVSTNIYTVVNLNIVYE